MKTYTYWPNDQQERFQEFWTLDRLGKALWMQEHRRTAFVSRTIVVQDNFLGISSTVHAISRGIYGFYPKRTTSWLFKYDLDKKRGHIDADRTLIKNILKRYPEWEFLESLDWDRCLSMAVVRDIMLGKLTSVDAVVRAYCKSLGIKGYSGKELQRLKILGYLVESLAVFDVDKLIPALRDEDRASLLYNQFDVIEQAYLLGIKLNPFWSEKRFHAEHQRLTRILMQHKLDKMECLPVWDLPSDFSSYLSIPRKVEFLNNEKVVFEEGTFMHHCLYTNYWRKIKAKQYIAFSIMLPSGEKATLGIRRTSYGAWQFDQCYRKYDRPIEGTDNDYVTDLTRRICSTFPTNE